METRFLSNVQLFRNRSENKKGTLESPGPGFLHPWQFLRNIFVVLERLAWNIWPFVP